MRFASALLVISLGACSRSLPEPPALGPVGEAEARALGERIAQRLATCNADELAAETDAVTFVRRTLEGVELDATKKATIVESGSGAMLWQVFCRTLVGTRSAVVHSREVDGSARPILRVLTTTAYDYVEVELGMVDGRARVVDLMSYSSGLRASDNVNIMARIGFAGGGGAAQSEPLQRFTKCSASGDAACARGAIADFPEELRASRPVRLMLLGLSWDDDATFLARFAELERDFPNDPALPFLSIDRHMRSAQWPQALAAIDKLDAVVHDPFLDTQRAVALRSLKDFPAARKAAERAVAALPDLVEAHETRANTCVAMGDHACAVESFGVLSERFGSVRTDAEIALLDGGPALLASPEWKAFRAP